MKKTFFQAHEDNQELGIKLPINQKWPKPSQRKRRDQTEKEALIALRKENIRLTVFEGTCIVRKPNAIENPKQNVIW